MERAVRTVSNKADDLNDRNIMPHSWSTTSVSRSFAVEGTTGNTIVIPAIAFHYLSRTPKRQAE